MKEFRTIPAFAAVALVSALAACTTVQPTPPASAALVVVPTPPTAALTAEARTIRSGTITAIQEMNATPGSTQGSSGGTSQSGASSGSQLVTVQFDNGTTQQYQLVPVAGAQTFQVGDRIKVDSRQDTIMFSH